MKKHKSMIILIGILIVCVALYFATTLIPSDEEASEPPITVTNMANVNALTYTDGETTLSFEKKDDIWSLLDEDMGLDQDAMTDMVGTISSIQAQRKMEQPDELSGYGLDKPQYTIDLSNEEGLKITLHVGALASDGNYYAKLEDKDTIYTINSTVVEALEFDQSALEVAEEEEVSTEEDSVE